jgi:hypothetical protein
MLKVYALTLYEINKPLGIKDLQENPLEEVIPKEYHEFLPLFCKSHRQKTLTSPTLKPEDKVRRSVYTSILASLQSITKCVGNSKRMN